jgi:BASS family bile acid:Na+ symporter
MNWDYATYEYFLSAALLICAMFGMGATLSAKDFLGVLKAPKGLCLIIVMQIVVMPVIAIMLARIFELPTGITVGMVLVSALPGGLFSNVLTFLGRGNIALSVSATAVCTVGCLFSTVAVLKIFAATELPDDFSMPAGKILAEVGLCLLLPLLLGMTLHRAAPRLAPKVTVFCLRASWVMLVIIVSAALLAGRLDLTAYGWKSPLVLILFGMIALWLSYAAAFLFRLSIDDTFTVGVEVVVRNSHLGILLKAALFSSSDTQHLEIADGVLYTVLLYAGICLLITISEVVAKRKKLGPVFGRTRKRNRLE